MDQKLVAVQKKFAGSEEEWLQDAECSKKHNIPTETSGSSKKISRYKRRMVPGCRMVQQPHISTETSSSSEELVGSREEWLQDVE